MWAELHGLILDELGARGELDAFSERPAPATVKARINPIVSVRMPRFRPAIFFEASAPWLVTGTLVEVFTLWVSMTEAVGSGVRPSLTRAKPVKS